MSRYLLCILLLFASGCAAPPGGPAIHLEEERSALMEADAAWFRSHDNLEEFVTFLAEGAVFMPDGAPEARGDSIRATWESLLSMPGFHLEWEASNAYVAEAGDMGYTFGGYELTVEQGGVSMVTVGKYVTVWEKQADRSWKVVVDCFNSNGPASAM